MTSEEYDEVEDTAKSDTAKLEEMNYLSVLNARLQKKQSFIAVREDGVIIYNGSEELSSEELENELSRSELVKEILVREKDKIIEAEIFPDYEYAKKKHIKDIRGKLQELIDGFNKDMPVYKRIYSLIVRETEFEKTPSKKIKRF